ncbi:trigger factor [Myxococcota bacterium]|nr:trigger factor [Myxococcota bacterium]MBU1431070.1 trigger factor [Myxococcota bacterium]MBU1898768.1 trigger factor [Myxococcota bacterium]
MHLEIESLELSQKRVHVTVPAKRVDAALASAFNRISQTLNLSGFRRGRVPMSHLKKRYGAQAAAEATEQLVDQAWRLAIKEHGVQPVAQPQFDFKAIEQGQDYIFDITVEAAPDFDLPVYESLQLEKTEWLISDEIIDHELEHVAEQVPTYAPIEDRDEARDGDRVHFSYLGRVAGEPFKGGADEDAHLVLGSGQFIPGFEPQIIGRKVGEKFDVNVTFPADYHSDALAGAEAIFECELKGLESVTLPEINDALAAQVGAEDLADLREKIKTRVLAHHEERNLSEMKDAIKAELSTRYSFELPPTPLKALIEEKKQQAEEQLDEDKIAALTREAEEELRLEFIIDAIADEEGLEVTSQELNAFFAQMLQQMGPYAQQLMPLYREPRHQAAIRERIRRDKVLDFLISKANVTLVSASVPAHNHDHE